MNKSKEFDGSFLKEGLQNLILPKQIAELGGTESPPLWSQKKFTQKG